MKSLVHTCTCSYEDWWRLYGFLYSELNTLGGRGGTMILAGLGFALGFILRQSDLSLETDSADLLDSESTDLILLTTLEYDLVIGLVSLIPLGSDSLMVGYNGCRYDGWM